MSKIRIGTNERELAEANESWVNQQVNQRKDAGQPVCAQVILKTGSIDMILSTPACQGSGGGGGGRPPTAQEKSIFDLWNKLHLNEAKWASGGLVAFLKQVQRLI